jgi:EAL domain-containing protein (putative c-di-GMP-specific phosphodiesterase class I)
MHTQTTDSISRLDVTSLIDQQSAAAFFQPIVSIQRKSVVGLEAKGWGIDPENRQLIDPSELFRATGNREHGLSLDRLLRHKGLLGFKEIQAKSQGLVLFLGVEASVLTKDVVGSGHLRETVARMGLDPRGIVIELSWSPTMDLEAVKRFMDDYRKRDFLFALRDLDIRRESLDRAFQINPDVLKLSPDLVRGASKDSCRRSGLKSLVSLGHRMGGLVVANGVENEEDALTALEMGADMLQGGYFSKAQRSESAGSLGLKARVVFVASRYKRLLTERVGRDKDRKGKFETLASAIAARCEGLDLSGGEEWMKGLLKLHPQLECVYLLDQDGIQRSETHCGTRSVVERKRYLFQPAPRGTDHSLKGYYYELVYSGGERYFTEPYVSLASGNLCVTGSILLRKNTGKSPVVLCFDIDLSRV